MNYRSLPLLSPTALLPADRYCGKGQRLLIRLIKSTSESINSSRPIESSPKKYHQMDALEGPGLVEQVYRFCDGNYAKEGAVPEAALSAMVKLMVQSNLIDGEIGWPTRR